MRYFHSSILFLVIGGNLASCTLSDDYEVSNGDDIGAITLEVVSPNWILTQTSNSVCYLDRDNHALYYTLEAYVADRYEDTTGCRPPSYKLRQVDKADCMYGVSQATCKSAMGLSGFPVDNDLCPRPRVTDPNPSGEISANPTIVGVLSGQLGATVISWDSSHIDNAQVYVRPNGGAEQLFAQSAAGSQSADWIQGSRQYEFRLYANTTHQCLIDSVTVYGITRVCGNGICEAGETQYNCIRDCGAQCNPICP